MRDERFARLVEQELLPVVCRLSGPNDEEAVVTDDYGIAVAGIRYATPDEAAAAVTGHDGPVDGWEFWTAATTHGQGSLAELKELVDA